MDLKFEEVLGSYKTGEMTRQRVKEVKDLLLLYKNEICQDKILGRKTFLRQCELYFKIFFTFSLQKALKKQDFVMIREAIHTLWSVIVYRNLCQHRFLLKRLTSTLDVYLSVDRNANFSKEFLRLYTGLITASSEEIRNVARSSFKSYKLLGQLLKDSNDMEMQSLIVEVLLKLYFKKGFDVLLQDVISNAAEILTQTEDINTPNALYRCVKHLLKPGGIPLPTTDIVTLNCQVAIDGCLLIGQDLGDENLTKFNRQNKTISFFCAASFFTEICNLDNFCATTSWEVLSFSASDVENFNYSIRPISQTLQMEIIIQLKCFNIFLEQYKKSKIIISISPDERAHDILLNTIFPEFFYRFCKSIHTLNIVDLKETEVESQVSGYSARKKIKHSRSELFLLSRSLSPLSLKEIQKVSPKRSALTNKFQSKAKKMKFCTIENRVEHVKKSCLKNAKSKFSTLRSTPEGSAVNLDISNKINASLNTKLYNNVRCNNAIFDASFSKVEEWLRLNPVERKSFEKNFANLPQSEFIFATPTIPVIPKSEVIKTECSETGSKNITFSETSSNLPVSQRVNRYLTQEPTTRHETENVCSSQELYNILREDLEKEVNITRDSFSSHNDDCLNQNDLESVTKIAQKNIANTSCPLNLTQDLNNFDGSAQKLINESNSKIKSTLIFDFEERELKRTLQQNQYPIVLLKRMSFENYENSYLSNNDLKSISVAKNDAYQDDLIETNAVVELAVKTYVEDEQKSITTSEHLSLNVFENSVDKKKHKILKRSSIYSKPKCNLQTAQSEKQQHTSHTKNSSQKIETVKSNLKTNNLEINGSKVASFLRIQRTSKDKKKTTKPLSNFSSSIKGISPAHSGTESNSSFENTCCSFKRLNVSNVPPLNLSPFKITKDPILTNFEHTKVINKHNHEDNFDSILSQQKSIIKIDKNSSLTPENKLPRQESLLEENNKAAFFTKYEKLSKNKKKETESVVKFSSDLFITNEEAAKSKLLGTTAIYRNYIDANPTLTCKVSEIIQDNVLFSEPCENKIFNNVSPMNHTNTRNANEVKRSDNKMIFSGVKPKRDITEDHNFRIIATSKQVKHRLLYKKKPKTKFSTKSMALSKLKKKEEIPKTGVKTRNKYQNFLKWWKLSSNRTTARQKDIINKDLNCSNTTASSRLLAQRQLYKENDDTFVSFPGENIVSAFNSPILCYKSPICNTDPKEVTTANKTFGKQTKNFGTKTKKTYSSALQELFKNQKVKNKIESKFQKQFPVSSDDSFIPLDILEKNQNSITQSNKKWNMLNKVVVHKDTAKLKVCDNSPKIKIISDIVLQNQEGMLDLVFKAGIKGVKETPQADLVQNQNARTLYNLLHNIFEKDV